MMGDVRYRTAFLSTPSTARELSAPTANEKTTFGRLLPVATSKVIRLWPSLVLALCRLCRLAPPPLPSPRPSASVASAAAASAAASLCGARRHFARERRLGCEDHRCSVLEFGPVPTPPTPLFQGAPVPKGAPPLDQWDGSQLLPARCCCAGSRGDRYKYMYMCMYVRWGAVT